MSARRTDFLRKCRYLVFLLVVTFVLSEVGTRLMTRTWPNGTQYILRFPLLPYRPSAAAVSDWLTDADRAEYLVWDETLGWTIAPGASKGVYEVNSQGIRARRDRVFTTSPPEGQTRIVAVGDSYVHGDDVPNEETWTHHLEALREDYEVLNFGVSAYGTDQALLRWRRDASKFEAHVVLLGIWPENICRNLNLFRYYLGQSSGFMTKPRFLLEGDRLKQINLPVVTGPEMATILSEPDSAKLLEHEFWIDSADTADRFYYRSRVLRTIASLFELHQRSNHRQRLYTGEDPRGIEITVAIAEQFRREVSSTGSIPLVVIMPMPELLDLQAGENSFPLVEALRQAGLDVLDLGPPIVQAVKDYGMERIFLDKTGYGHLTPIGNRILAERLEHMLRRHTGPPRQGPGSSVSAGPRRQRVDSAGEPTS